MLARLPRGKFRKFWTRWSSSSSRRPYRVDPLSQGGSKAQETATTEADVPNQRQICLTNRRVWPIQNHMHEYFPSPLFLRTRQLELLSLWECIFYALWNIWHPALKKKKRKKKVGVGKELRTSLVISKYNRCANFNSLHNARNWHKWYTH